MSLWRWRVALVVWMGLIFLTSSSLFAPQMASDGTEQWFGSLNYVARKLAHIGEYAILTYFWLRGTWTVTHRFRFRLAWSAALSVLYAATDEYHQSLVPQRDGVWTDVVWDAAGALAAVCILWWIYRYGAAECRRRALGALALTPQSSHFTQGARQ